MFFRVVCSDCGQDPHGNKAPKCFKIVVFSRILFGVAKTVFLANGHFAGVTPAIFVIFVDFQGPRSKIPCFCGQNAISEFSPIFVKTTCFREGTKRPFSKTTVSTTLIFGLLQGVASFASRGEKSEKHCLENTTWNCDPAGLVQCPNSWIPPKSVGEGASSPSEEGPGVAKMSLALEQPQDCTCGASLGLL